MRYLKHRDISIYFELSCERCGSASEVSFMIGEEGQRCVSCKKCGQLYLTFKAFDGASDAVLYDPPHAGVEARS
ncbi:MAG: hypothetical protein WCB68_10650 [Pyrinomonadaceae bacterium]